MWCFYYTLLTDNRELKHFFNKSTYRSLTTDPDNYPLSASEHRRMFLKQSVCFLASQDNQKHLCGRMKCVITSTLKAKSLTCPSISWIHPRGHSGPGNKPGLPLWLNSGEEAQGGLSNWSLFFPLFVLWSFFLHLCFINYIQVMW